MELDPGKALIIKASGEWSLQEDLASCHACEMLF